MFERSSGTTRTERLLARLAEHAFLRLWTYPNLFRDQGGGKEVCDLIVAFDRDVILFSDKSITFQPGDLGLAWQRWHDRAVDASVEQLVGARRWLKAHPDRLFLDRQCRQRFPLSIDPGATRFHLVCIAAGAAERCKAELGGSGSLVIGAHDALAGRPFAVSTMYRDEVVLVLDEITMPIVLSELDTVADFVAYLRAREDLARSERLHVSLGEEQVLALYISRLLTKKTPPFPSGDRAMAFADDMWSGVSEDTLGEYHEHVQPSYAWDSMIEEFNQHVIDDTLIPIRNSKGGFSGHESRLRVLARTTRAERRELALALAGLLAKPREPGDSNFRCLRQATRPDTIYAFIIAPSDDFSTEQEYREHRAEMMEAYCMSIKASHADVSHVVGIASTPVGSARHSEDVCYLDAQTWTPEQQTFAETIREASGYYRSAYVTVQGGAASLMSPTHRQRIKNADKRRRKLQRR